LDAALLAAALLMGVAGGPHCAAMCGAACNAVAGGSRALSPAMLALHAGRLAGYAGAGAVAAAGIASLGDFQSAAPLLRPLWSMVHVAAIVLGAWLLWTARTPGWFSTVRPRLAALATEQPVRVWRRLPRPAGAALGGACWVAIPCGLLQSALLVAALASTPAAGAAAMAAFAAGSTSVLWLAQGLWSGLSRGAAQPFAAVSVRLAGALLMGSSLFALWHGLGAAFCAALV
jgi:sulfite exporter TauE/SafE